METEDIGILSLDDAEFESLEDAEDKLAGYLLADKAAAIIY